MLYICLKRRKVGFIYVTLSTSERNTVVQSVQKYYVTEKVSKTESM